MVEKMIGFSHFVLSIDSCPGSGHATTLYPSGVFAVPVCLNRRDGRAERTGDQESWAWIAILSSEIVYGFFKCAPIPSSRA